MWNWVAGLVGAAFLAYVGASAVTASNTVPPTRAGESTNAATPNDFKPPACSMLNLLVKITGSGHINPPGNESALITGSNGPDRIQGKNGDDCILGGAGDDDLNGGPGTDVCIGGPGVDGFVQCEVFVQ